MANYVTGTSDKTKAGCLKAWKMGLFGLLGFENFYVMKIKVGIIRALIGAIVVMFGVTGLYAFTTGTSSLGSKIGFAFTVLVTWAVISIPNLYRISVGKFRDNVGYVVKE